MKPELILITGKHSSTFTQSARGTCKQWSPWAMALVILLGLAAVPPSAQGQALTVLHSFEGGTDGESPSGGVVRDAAGNLYGTSAYGGTFNFGTVFKLDSAGNETVLYSFTGGTDGAIPLAGLIRDAAGNLYGTTEVGGDLTCNSGIGCGTVFKLQTTGKETVLHSFTGSPDGASPIAGMIRDAAGNLYGTTSAGGIDCGSLGCGTVFKLDAAGKETLLHSFTGGADGTYPDGGVIRDAAGNLYGTTAYGGTYNFGTVFKLNSTGTETVLYRFRNRANGQYPVGGVIRDKAGNLYGATEVGGAFSSGTVFKLDTTGKETVLHNFAGGADGQNPVAGVIRDGAGVLYGTTQYGGGVTCFGSGCGTVFKVDTTGKETVLYSFTGGADGAAPLASLVRDAAGNLYGTAYFDGDSGPLCSVVGGCGVVFKIAP
jgi:uncharacterized repeat protein (TIGR03803 family)